MESVVLLAGALFSSSSGISWIPGTLLEHLLFARSFAAQALPGLPMSLVPITSAAGTLIFIAIFATLFVLYLLAVRYLPRHISHRYVVLSTLLLGSAYLFIPIVTSQDIFSYIAYARMGVVYHLNPLTTLPTSISSDPIYPLLYWVRQPSAYGPAWTIITSTLQWVALFLGFRGLLSIELLLRVLGLSLHLGSTQLIWSISGHLLGIKPRRQRRSLSPLRIPARNAAWSRLVLRTHLAGAEAASASHSGGVQGEGAYGGTLYGQRQRRRAVLAFAWNPFLLLEACVNAHSDTAILFFVLLALWMLLPRVEGTRRDIMLPAVMLALAACVKITLVLLLPGLLLFLWKRQFSSAYGRNRFRDVVTATCQYTGVIVLLYAPFWQHGDILQLLRVSPAAIHDVNSPYQFVACLIDSLRGITIPTLSGPGSSIEAISHLVSMLLFAIVYGALCTWPLVRPRYVNTLPALIRWMALAWLLYCVIGSPWFWPWYTITLFGLLTLIEVDGRMNTRIQSILRSFPVGGFARMLTISMFSLYTFGEWQPWNSSSPLAIDFSWLYANGYFPLLPHFLWEYFAGLWIWALPFLVIGAWLLLARRHKNTMRWQQHDLPAEESDDGSPVTSSPMRSFTSRPPLR